MVEESRNNKNKLSYNKKHLVEALDVFIIFLIYIQLDLILSSKYPWIN